MFNLKKLRTCFTAVTLAMIMLFVTKTTVYGATYTVSQGDSLYKIGLLFNTTVNEIKTKSNISNNEIYPGQLLNVTANVYTVKDGDSIFLIGKKLGISVNSLRKANNKCDDLIYPGQKLILPSINSNNAQSSTQPVSVSVSSNAAFSYSQSDVDLLARLITAEADGQPYNAKVAVGAVVINRVKSTLFATSISGVIYQRINGYYQFTPVLNGWINKPATDIAKKAAYDALRGIDPSNGALFYFDNSITNTWLLSKPIKAKIDKMVFAY